MEPDKWMMHYDEIGDTISDKAYNNSVAHLYSGILAIGYCGCSNYQRIVLN
jgi:hypothetical protein